MLAIKESQEGEPTYKPLRDIYVAARSGSRS